MRILKFLSSWVPPIALMATIFFLSSRQRIAVSDVYTVNFFVFKSFHVIEYAILYMLLIRAYVRTFRKKSPAYLMTAAAITAILYGISDELHQTFVPTREGTVRDVFIDALGISLSFLYTKNKLDFLKRFL